jgi:hypothetical protein
MYFTVYMYIADIITVYYTKNAWKGKNCTLVQALRLCTGHTAHRGSRGIALLYRC